MKKYGNIYRNFHASRSLRRPSTLDILCSNEYSGLLVGSGIGLVAGIFLGGSPSGRLATIALFGPHSLRFPSLWLDVDEVALVFSDDC